MENKPTGGKNRPAGSETPVPKARASRVPRPEKTRQELLAEFEAAPPYAVFSQIYVAVVRDCSTFTIERDRWAGTGVPFIKPAGTRQVRYRKSDILAWLESHGLRRSTSEDARGAGQPQAEPRLEERGGKPANGGRRGHGKH